MAADHAISEGVATRVRTIYAPRALEAEKAVQEHIKNLSQFKVRIMPNKTATRASLTIPPRCLPQGAGCSTTKTTRSTA